MVDGGTVTVTLAPAGPSTKVSPEMVNVTESAFSSVGSVIAVGWKVRASHMTELPGPAQLTFTGLVSVEVAMASPLGQGMRGMPGGTGTKGAGVGVGAAGVGVVRPGVGGAGTGVGVVAGVGVPGVGVDGVGAVGVAAGVGVDGVGVVGAGVGAVGFDGAGVGMVGVGVKGPGVGTAGAGVGADG